jgi:hypothetical protein
MSMIKVFLCLILCSGLTTAGTKVFLITDAAEAVAGWFHVPVVFMTGDQAAV